MTEPSIFYLCPCPGCMNSRALVAALAAQDQPAPVVVPGDTPDQCRPGRANELQEALRALVVMVRRTAGYMPTEDQRALWRAETLLGMR